MYLEMLSVYIFRYLQKCKIYMEKCGDQNIYFEKCKTCLKNVPDIYENCTIFMEK